MRAMNGKAVFLVFLVCALHAAYGQAKQNPAARHRYAEETGTETLWTERYAQCDYGFYVMLPPGFVGHGSHNPNPNHGFLLALPDTGRTSNASLKDERFIFVNANYNSFEVESLAGAAHWAVDVMSSDKTGFREISREPVRLDKRRAMRIRAEHDGPNGRVIEERVITLRAGILYEIGLVTRPGDYAADKSQFEKVLLGFRYWRIHYCCD
jgi:hypothetical protein